MGSKIIALKRKSPDQTEEIVCITNISGDKALIPAAGIPDFDLIENRKIVPEDGNVVLHPYRTFWLIHR